jgi:hypothetical protein
MAKKLRTGKIEKAHAPKRAARRSYSGKESDSAKPAGKKIVIRPPVLIPAPLTAAPVLTVEDVVTRSTRTRLQYDEEDEIEDLDED